jgi:putative PIG3 family NAD(P)H quinone oxidoreductase
MSAPATFKVEKHTPDNGPVCPKGANVKVHYTGRLTNGKVFADRLRAFFDRGDLFRDYPVATPEERTAHTIAYFTHIGALGAFALAYGGGDEDYCAVPATQCLPWPREYDAVRAAALPETFFTVWHNVFERGYAVEGETILVHGGTSGIGSMAIKLAQLFGISIIVTCGSDEKCAAAIALGAAHAINYKSHDFVEEVKRLTDGKGVHLVLDMVAGSYVPRNLACLREDGRHVTIAVQGGLVAEINMAQVMSRRLTLTGSTLRPRSNQFKALLADEIHHNVWPDVVAGRLRPTMAKSFPLVEAAAAHKLMESGDFVGKIVLIP